MEIQVVICYYHQRNPLDKRRYNPSPKDPDCAFWEKEGVKLATFAFFTFLAASVFFTIPLAWRSVQKMQSLAYLEGKKNQQGPKFTKC